MPLESFLRGQAEGEPDSYSASRQRCTNRGFHFEKRSQLFIGAVGAYGSPTCVPALRVLCPLLGVRLAVANPLPFFPAPVPALRIAPAAPMIAALWMIQSQILIARAFCGAYPNVQMA